MFANLFHELVFEAPCPEEDRDLIVSSAHNVIHALKCCTMRDMKLRARLTKRLEEKIVEYKDVLEGVFDENISLHQSALHLQGAFFHTGCVQLSEAMAHLVLAIAQTPGVQAKLQADDTGNYLRMVMQEQLRLFPLFGVAHRIASNDIEFNGEIIPTGTVLLFNYPAYQTTGFDRPHEFVPERWEKLTERECNYIPFGVVGNRPCPGRQLSEVWMKAIATTMVERVEFQSSIPHTRSLPGRGQCLIASRKHGGLAQLGGVKSSVVMGLMAAQEATEGVVRSVAQLIYGTQMLLDAKKKKMALRFFQGADVDTLDPIET